MSQNKPKFYKNSQRNTETAYKPYVPQYQILGVEPQEWKTSSVPSNTRMAVPNQDNPRVKSVTMRQEYSKPTTNQHLPNVGSYWSSMDANVIDDLDDHPPDGQFIDNNDYVSSEAFEMSPGSFETSEQRGQILPPSAQTPDYESSIHNSLKKLSSNSYLLMVNDIIICSGSLEEVQEQARDLVFGEHELCDGTPIPMQDLIILKKINIKVGLFLE